jgi:hypothetical protein
MLLGVEKTVNEALRQALELQAVLVAASPHKNNTKTSGEPTTPPPPPGEETRSNQDAAAVQNRATSGMTASAKGRLIISDARNMKIGQTKIRGNRQESQNYDRVKTKKRTARKANRLEMSEDRRRRADAGVCTKAPITR